MDPHPLYTAAERLMERGMSRREMKRLLRLFEKHGLPLPVDFQTTLQAEGFVLPSHS